MGFFERYLTVWVLLCIIAVIALGYVLVRFCLSTQGRFGARPA